jgi:tetratricopeptide (TPR) repeat protein
VEVAPDLKQLLLRTLLKLDQDATSPHRLMMLDTPFLSSSQFFTALHAEITQHCEKHRQAVPALARALTPGDSTLEKLPPSARFERLVSALADAISQSVSSFVLILDPPEVKDPEAYRQAVGWLAENTRSRWAKYLVLDDRLNSLLDRIETESRRAAVQEFHFPPEAIEKQIRADVHDPRRLTPFERRQYVGMLAGFAFARQQYAEAERLQRGWLEMIDREGKPEEKANALYNLGNTHLGKREASAAEQSFVGAVEVCLAQGLSPLLPLVLTNLGVALHRQGKTAQALKSFQIARDNCRAQKLRPVEAHVLDCLANVYQQHNQCGQAEQCWLQALALYEGIASEFFDDLRQAGSEDILIKLERLYRATGQADKLDRLRRRQEEHSHG